MDIIHMDFSLLILHNEKKLNIKLCFVGACTLYIEEGNNVLTKRDFAF